MATFPCPGCQAPVSTDARFCGRCGATISERPRGANDEETVRAPKAMLAKTMLDPIPYGEAEGTKQDLAQTMSDPAAAERALEMRKQVLAAVAATEPEAAPAPMHKTLLIGGPESAPPAPPPAQHPEPSPLSRSVLAPQGFGSEPPPKSVQPASNPPPPPAPGAAAKTMMGMPASALVPPHIREALAAPPVAPAPAPAPTPGTQMFGAAAPAPAAPAPAPVHLPPAQKTMMGVAIPGIAPTHQNAPPPGPNAQQFESRQGTMMGVAVPGIAPVHASPHARAMTAVIPAAAPPPVLPAPPPLALEPLPEAPRIVKKQGGVSLGAVLGVIAVILVGAGAVGAFLFLRSPSPLTAHPQLDETGKEFLALQCPSCPDGTNVSLGASTATIKGGAAILALPAPLAIGDNDIQIKIDRPGTGRDEDVRIPLHVSYRVRADLSTLSAKPPAITVRVEAQPGSTVQVDGKPLAVDAQGKGAYVIDLSQESEGASDEQKPFERKIPVVVTEKNGKEETDQLTARTSIVPLHVDAPGMLLFTDKATYAISGQTRVNGVVTIDGAPAPVDDKGHFAVRLPLADVGEKKIEIIAGAPPLAPRTVHATVVRVASLDAKAKELAAEGPLAYDAFATDTAKKVGQKAVVEGEIVEARSGQGYSSLLVDDRKTCAKGTQCLVRILLGEESTLAHGDTVRVFGKIAGVASGKQPIPDVDASLVLTLKAGRH